MMNDPLIQAHSLKDLTPQQRVWSALHQDYSHRYVWEEIQEGKLPSDEECGKTAINSLLKGGKGHFGPVEQAGFTVAVGYAPHSVMQQLRTHRIAVTFDCQSFRYTSQGIIEAYENAAVAINEPTWSEEIERVVYLPPTGLHKDRHNPSYHYSPDHRMEDLDDCFRAMAKYTHRVKGLNFAPQHARGMLPFDYRQHFVVSFNNLRSLWHMADLRLKPDAQDETVQTVQAIWDALKDECPELNEWYEETRLKRGMLAP